MHNSATRRGPLIMQYHLLAVDYDGTIATDGHVDDITVEALQLVKKSGRRLVLVTGRVLPSLVEAFPHLKLFDLVVAENGALVYDPATEETTLLATPPPVEFMNTLSERGVPPLEIGHVIVATWTPHETVVFETIRDLALELQVIFNKGAVMVLPSSINKAVGLAAALEKLGISVHNVVGVGDAENDHAFLMTCSVSAAVANALDSVKHTADWVLSEARGAGVAQVIEQLLANDLERFHRRPNKGALLGHDLENREVRVPLVGSRILVTGDPAAGKSRFAISVLERLMEEGYQTCIIDPEGDYQGLKSAIVLGTREQTPAVEEVLEVLSKPKESCVVTLFATEKDEQPESFNQLLRGLLEFRRKTGRPHWILIDEAHYPLPDAWHHGEDINIEQLGGVMFITAFTDRLHSDILKTASAVLALSEDPARLFHAYCDLVKEQPCELLSPSDGQTHQAAMWWRGEGAPFWLKRIEPKGQHLRHQSTYLEGEMDDEYKFYFRGPKNELNLGAQNLRMFLEMGKGVDDETWLFHLKRGDYANWFRDVIRDEELAAVAQRLEKNGEAPEKSRQELAEFIALKYGG
jgi:hydroxymethylpyrimidine pyrophosphatase-like HAD family hydrolase